MRYKLGLYSAARYLVTLAALVGCYKYTPLETADPAEGKRIAVALTPAGTDSLARFVGPNATGIEGRLLEAGGSHLLLAVLMVRKRNGEEDFWKGEAVRIPQALISGVQQRRLAVGRTLLLVGAVAVAGATVGVAATSGSGGGGGGDGGPPPVE